MLMLVPPNQCADIYRQIFPNATSMSRKICRTAERKGEKRTLESKRQHYITTVRRLAQSLSVREWQTFLNIEVAFGRIWRHLSAHCFYPASRGLSLLFHSRPARRATFINQFILPESHSQISQSDSNVTRRILQFASHDFLCLLHV